MASWQAGNPMRSSKFQGAYVEMGYLLCGEGYGYDDEYGLLRGSNERGDLEIVARYSYTDLNDINKGDFFLIGKQVFYPGGVVADYPEYWRGTVTCGHDWRELHVQPVREGDG